jgi:hypothetical protein
MNDPEATERPRSYGTFSDWAEWQTFYPEREVVGMPRIDDTFLGSVVYIYSSVKSAERGEHEGGTGVIIACRLSQKSKYGQIYIITNRHVIKGSKSKTIALRFNAVGGSTQVLSTKKEDWVTAYRDDLAAYPIDLSNSDCKGTVIADYAFVSEEIIGMYDIGPGDQTFMIGRLITHDGRQRNTPVVRFGNIAMMPLESVRTQGEEQIAFLVECRSLGGFSGSPVFVWISEGYRPNFRRLDTPHGPWLLGINCGHFVMPATNENAAVEIVIPAWRLHNFLNEPPFPEQRAKAEKDIEQKLAHGFVVYDDLIDRLRRLDR